MEDVAFSPGSPEAEIEQRSRVLLMPQGERGKIGFVTLTNDRILFSQQKFDSTPGSGAVAALVAHQLQKRAEKKAGGPREVLSLSDIQSVRRVRRPLRGDLYEFTLTNGSTCGLGASAGKAWDPKIRRLLTERHGRTLADAGEGSWQVQ
jgi:hypothetical protein